ILLIDEILGVGDEHFSRKSKAKLDEFKRKDVAIILVTHGLDTVENWCTRAIWLNAGRIAADGDPRWVVDQYRKHTQQLEAGSRPSEQTVEERPRDANRWGEGEALLKQVVTMGADGTPAAVFNASSAFRLRMVLNRPPPSGAVVGFILYSADGVRLMTS